MNAPERPEPIEILDGNPDSVGSIHVRNVYSMTDANAYMDALEAENARLREEVARKDAALIRLRDCDWVITLPDRMDAVRDIARTALAPVDAPTEEKP